MQLQTQPQAVMQSRVNVMLPTVRTWMFRSTVCKGGVLPRHAQHQAGHLGHGHLVLRWEGDREVPQAVSWAGKEWKNWKTMNNYMVPSGIYIKLHPSIMQTNV